MTHTPLSEDQPPDTPDDFDEERLLLVGVLTIYVTVLIVLGAVLIVLVAR